MVGVDPEELSADDPAPLEESDPPDPEELSLDAPALEEELPSPLPWPSVTDVDPYIRSSISNSTENFPRRFFQRSTSTSSLHFVVY